MSCVLDVQKYSLFFVSDLPL